MSASSKLDVYRQSVLRVVQLEALREDPVAKRVRYVFFPSSGHEVLIIDNAMMLQVRSGEVLSHRKKDGYLGPDRLAQEVLVDIFSEERSAELLLARAKSNWQRAQALRKK